MNNVGSFENKFVSTTAFVLCLLKYNYLKKSEVTNQSYSNDGFCMLPTWKTFKVIFRFVLRLKMLDFQLSLS